MFLEFINRIFYRIPSVPKTVQICITNRCNFDCPMCQRFDLGVEIKQMELATFKKILSQLSKGVENIILTGWGEPLTHPDLLEMIKLCKEKGYDVRFTTNGALLTEEMMEKLIASGLDAISFSIESIKPKENGLGHSLKGQLEKIVQLKQKIKEKGSCLKIYTQTVLQKNEEQDVLDITDFAIKHELDRVRLTRLDIRFRHYDRPSFAEEKALIQKIEQRIKVTGNGQRVTSHRLGLDFLPHTAFDGLAKKIYKLTYKRLHKNGKYCLRTFNDAYITVDGQVTPCCALPFVKLGNILEEDLKTIWNNSLFRQFRQHQPGFCGKCDVLNVRTFN